MQREVWNNIPLLHVYNEEIKQDAPVILFLHGFMSAKEHNLHYAYHLVEKGIRVILPDAPLHGERAENVSEVQMNAAFWRIVLNYVKEVQEIYEALQAYGFNGKIGVIGTSMGGITTTGCLKKYDWIDAAGVLMGAVSYTEMAQFQIKQLEEQGIDVPMTAAQQQAMLEALQEYNVTTNRAIFERIPVVFWHGQKDSVVPFQMTYPFYETLVEQGRAQKVRYIVDEKAGHAVSRAGVLAVTEWLAQHLA
ncbi:alpha/beta fold hydrolase [Lysinibacillus sp. KU-BSD001]|uniref:alpha/beta fold hydrolase n=1 Tax=Lysinibacillus sp. KU-BSD001 TaxID=3141328 RepID=UPI0036DFBB29